MMTRRQQRRHGMSDDEDLDLFRREVSGARPLKQDKVAPFRRKPRPVPLGLDAEEEQPLFADMDIETPDFLEFRRPGIQRRLFRDLQSGHIETDASLDLHGLRVEEARAALASFLNDAGRYGWRCLHIIHGKGYGSRAQPILKQRINQWLRQRDEVLAFCSCPRWDGGTGAAYVLLGNRRRRR